MNSPPESHNDFPISNNDIVGPFTYLGPKLNELPKEEAEIVATRYIDGQKETEAHLIRAIDSGGKYLVFVSGGGITIGVGVATALISKDISILPLLPGFFLLILALSLCGYGIMQTGRLLAFECADTSRDIGDVFNGSPLNLVDRRILNRRIQAVDTPRPPFFIFSFIAFILGEAAFILGLAAPELFSLFEKAPNPPVG